MPGPNWKKKLNSQKKPKQPFRSVLENKPTTRLKGKPARVFSREFCAVVRYYLVCRAPGSIYFLQSPPWGVLKKNCSKNARKKSEEHIPLFYYLPDFLGREWLEFWNWVKIYWNTCSETEKLNASFQWNKYRVCIGRC